MHITPTNKAIKAEHTLLPELATALLQRIDEEQQTNEAFVTALETFAVLCQVSINPNISMTAIKEMLVQHVLTERLFRTMFNNPDFMRRNVIAAEIEKVIDALTSRSFSRQEFLAQLDYFYLAIEQAAATIRHYSEKQSFLNTVYERFFHGFSVKQADTHGIIYTPQTIVDFMCASVEEVLQREFGKTLSSEGVLILDPCVGTGNFMVNILHRLSYSTLRHKYEQELFCNEVMLLPYYIASLNIEHAYFELMQTYQPFTGMNFVDTLDMERQQQTTLFNQDNTIRVERQKQADIMVIIGNPPYNVGQINENDNNKNLPHKTIDQRVRETYAKDSRATNKNALSDMYVKFFRWAVDRLGDRDGIICFVTNNGFLQGIAFDGFRKHLAQEFTTIYHLNLGGNARKQGGGNVFGIMVGVGITLLVRNRANRKQLDAPATIYYHTLDNAMNGDAKLAALERCKNMNALAWQQLHPDAKQNWITEGLHAEFDTFLPMGTKEAKAAKRQEVETMFKLFSNGINTSRDIWAYNFTQTSLMRNIQRFIDTYNTEVGRWQQHANKQTHIDDFVLYDDTKTKWSEGLKKHLERSIYTTFEATQIRLSLYRPFCKQNLYFDRIMTERVYQFPVIFPDRTSEADNVVICVNLTAERDFACIMTETIANYVVAGGFGCPTRCFPFYTYNEDGSNRTENITDWAVQQFTAHYSMPIKKWDMFYYTYALLHHPGYRERYAENLRRELPRVPLLGNHQTFLTLAEIGQKLATLHVQYETVAEYPLEWVEQKPWTWRVEKMKLNKDKTALAVNRSLTLRGIPAEAFAYTLGNRSSLEWVIDQYQVKTDKRSGITNDPNRDDDPEYIARLVGRVVTVSVETMRLVEQIAAVPLTT